MTDIDLDSLPLDELCEFDALSHAQYLDTVSGYGFDSELAGQIRRHDDRLVAYHRMEIEAERGPSCEDWGPPHPTEDDLYVMYPSGYWMAA